MSSRKNFLQNASALAAGGLVLSSFDNKTFTILKNSKNFFTTSYNMLQRIAFPLSFGLLNQNANDHLYHLDHLLK